MLPRAWQLLVLTMLACVTGFAQGTTSRLLGTVQDASGAAIAGAAVRLTNDGTGITLAATTSESGTYVFDSIQSGLYSVTVEQQGFKRFTSRGNQVAIGQPTTVNVTLEVGGVAEQVEVVASAEQVQTSTSGNIGNLFQEQVIKDLPIVGTRGRNPLELVLRQPGVVGGANTGGGFHVNGARDRAWNFTLDGIDVNETSAGGSNFSPLRTNPDSLQEFRVLTGNFTADYGRNSGGQVAMVTRSGTNELHGSGFYFYRTPRLNANEWENNINRLGKRQFVQNIVGGSVGGPIIRNRTFFFGNLQVLRARESAQIDRTVYTATARQGIFRYVAGGRNLPNGVAGATVDASGNVLPGVSIGTYNVAARDPEGRGLDARIRQLIAGTPLPNNFNLGDGLNTAGFSFAALQREKQHDAVVKVDHIFNAQNTLYGRVAWGQQDTVCDRANGGSEFFPGTGCIVNTERAPRNYAFNYRWNPTPALTNELVVGRNYFIFDFVGPTTDISQVTLDSGPVTVPETFLANNSRALTTWQVVDNASYFRGAHTVKFGTNLRFQGHRDLRGSIAGQNAGPLAVFSRLLSTVDPTRFGLPADINTQFDRPNLESSINFLLGRVGSIRQGFVAEGNQFVAGLYDVNQKYSEYDFYVADTWKLRPNLTVDVGLRWEPKRSPRTDPEEKLLRPDQLVTFGATPTTSLRWVQGKLYDDDWNNLSPSVGFAWDPFGKGTTVVRSNYRIAYDRIPTFTFSSAVFPNLPGQTFQLVDDSVGANGVRLAQLQTPRPPTQQPSALAQPASFGNLNITVADPALRSPITHQWSFGVQHQVFNRTVVEVNYIGRRAYGLFGAYNANQAEIFRNGFLDATRTVAAGGESALINQLLGPDTRRTASETGSQAFRRIFAAELRNNAVGTIAANLGQRNQGGGRSLPELAGLGSSFFFAFPQFANGATVVDSNDFSTYHALQAQIERRYSNGFTAQLSYTLGKSLDTRSFDPVFTLAGTGTGQSASSTPFDNANRKLNYARSDFDRTHVVQSYFVYELPFGRGKRFGTDASGLVSRVIGGWQVSGLMTLQSGRPFTVYATNTLSSVVASPANYNGGREDGTTFEEQGLVFYFNEAQRGQFSIPGLGQLGNTSRNFFTGPGSFNMDAVLLKRTAITERVNLEIRADAINVTNTPTFGFPTAVVTSTTFGRIRDTVISGSRKIQLGAKINF